jgi:hypothetical protein
MSAAGRMRILWNSVVGVGQVITERVDGIDLFVGRAGRAGGRVRVLDRAQKGDASIYSPRVGAFFGRPRGRMVDCSPNRLTTAFTHVSEPKGVPRTTERRRASSSRSVCGLFTTSSQFPGKGIGPECKRLAAASLASDRRAALCWGVTVVAHFSLATRASRHYPVDDSRPRR